MAKLPAPNTTAMATAEANALLRSSERSSSEASARICESRNSIPQTAPSADWNRIASEVQPSRSPVESTDIRQKSAMQSSA